MSPVVRGRGQLLVGVDLRSFWATGARPSVAIGRPDPRTRRESALRGPSPHAPSLSSQLAAGPSALLLRLDEAKWNRTCSSAFYSVDCVLYEDGKGI